MSEMPYPMDLEIYAGDGPFSQEFEFTDDDDVAFNLTGYTPTAQWRPYARSATSVSFACAVTSPATAGKLTISLTQAQTLALTSGVWDLQIDNGTLRRTLLRGDVNVTEQVTR